MNSLEEPSPPRTPDHESNHGLSEVNIAEHLLQLFSPKANLPKSPHLSKFHSTNDKIIMSSPRRLRGKARVSYQESDESKSEHQEDGSDYDSADFDSSPQQHLDFEDSFDADDAPEKAHTPPPQLSAAGHSLRRRNELSQSLKGKENAESAARLKDMIVPKRKRFRRPRVVKSDRKLNAAQVQKSERAKVRDQIAAETAVKRANFFVANKDLFLPLLPEKNFISKLVTDSDAIGTPNTVPYQDLIEQPQGVKALMKSYQLKGLSFLVWLQKNGLSGILGDEMGLGKTLQTLSLIQWLKENWPSVYGGTPQPSLVVCPMSVLDSWMAEARKWTPNLKTLRFHGPHRERDRLKGVALGREESNTIGARKDISEEPDLIVTTYETFASEKNWFKRAFVWTYIILDEGHKVKSHESQISRILQGTKAEYRLILTGTPLQNNLLELWSLFHYLYPDVFADNTSKNFKESFSLNQGKVDTDFLDHARRLLELVMLRRMKSSPGVDLKLPPKTEVMLYVPLTSLQRSVYTALLTNADQSILQSIFQDSRAKEVKDLELDAGTRGWETKPLEEIQRLEQAGILDSSSEESKETAAQVLNQDDKSTNKSARDKLLNLLMQLRKVCNHPYTIPSACPDPYTVGEHILEVSGKFMILDKIIGQLVLKQRKKLLVFSGFTATLDFTEDYLSLRTDEDEKFRCLRLDGSTSRARRNLAIRLFNDVNSNYRVMLISTRAGGLGINLTAASDVVFLDQDFNPQITLQAEARAHRIGQTKPVTVYKLCTRGTVEEQMLSRIQKKLYLSAKVMESIKNIHQSLLQTGPKSFSEGSENDQMPLLSSSQLMSLVRRGAQAVSRSDLDIAEMAAWDFGTMLAKCQDSDLYLPNDEGAVNAQEREQAWLAEVEQVQTRIFNGKTFKKSRKSSNTDLTPTMSRKDRRQGKNTTVLIDGFAVSKESVSCGDWEAVPTLAGKDPRLADRKREKRLEIKHQEHCQVCWNGGDLQCCETCPRSYHYDCLPSDLKAKAKSKFAFYCSQHSCADCELKTPEAGGMLYRCRFCERAFCDDCLSSENTVLLGDTLKEFLLLGFGPVVQAFFVKCSSCVKLHQEDPREREFYASMVAEYDIEFAKRSTADLMSENEGGSSESLGSLGSSRSQSRRGSLTDATVLSSLSISAPCVSQAATQRKRHAQNDFDDSDDGGTKRARLFAPS